MDFQIAFEAYAQETMKTFISSELLLKSINYSLFSTGKRLRPMMMFAIASLDTKTAVEKLFPAALALEMVHTYSLIHDDLPCMDNDSMRRGKPTNHLAFDEATALLAGDGLLSQSFEILTQLKIDKEILVDVIHYFSKVIGIEGMVGGQAADIRLEKQKLEHVTLSDLQKIHYLKTGKLFEFAILLPTMVYQFPLSVKAILENFAKNIGVLYQAMDDYLDVATEFETGKTQGIDQLNNKITYLSFMSKEDLRNYLQNLEQECNAALQLLAIENYDIQALQKILKLILRENKI